MDLPENNFKAALSGGKLQIGLWSSLCSNIVTEIVADSGFDWILLDTEHSPNEVPDLLSQMQALSDQVKDLGETATKSAMDSVKVPNKGGMSS